eukprot:3013120-Rhodomonas_salina.3
MPIRPSTHYLHRLIQWERWYTQGSDTHRKCNLLCTTAGGSQQLLRYKLGASYHLQPSIGATDGACINATIMSQSCLQRTGFSAIAKILTI